MGKVIVLDGPAGSGKSTTAIELARRLGFVYLDTGAMYRALTLKFLLRGKEIIEDKTGLEEILDNTTIDLQPSENGLRIFLDGKDVTEDIRSNEVDGFVSEVAAVDRIREYLQAQQRRFGEKYDIVGEGRDLGTYVFPHAAVKIYLVADLDVRARRRADQKNAGTEMLAEFKKNLAKRDKIDSGRAHSPLKKADDAIEIDTTHLTFEQQIDKILEICRQKIK